MSAAGILHSDEVVFYHPLDNETEHTKGQAWTGSAGFVTGKIGSGKSGVTGTSISFASPTTDGSGLLPQGLCTVAKLSATKMCICYPSTSSVPAARIATISGTDVTFGAEQTFSDGYDIRRVASAALSSTTVIIGHFGTGADHWWQCLTVSGTDITSSSTLSYNGTGWYSQNVCALDSTTALGFMGETGKISLAVLTVSGGSLTMGSVNSTLTDGQVVDGCVKLDSTRVVFSYKATSGSAGLARVATVSGADVTVGSSHQFSSSFAVSNGGGDGTNGGVAHLGGGKIVILYKYGNTGRLIAGTVSGTDITFGTYKQFITWYAFGQIEALDSQKAVVIHKNMDTYPLRSRAFTITVSGTDITEGAEVGFALENGTTAAGQINALAVIDPASFFAFYTEYDLSERRGVVGQLAVTDASLTGAAGYPSTIGDTRVVVAMWARDLTAGSSTVTASCPTTPRLSDRSYSV